MDEQAMESVLAEALASETDDEGDPFFQGVLTFEEAGVLTTNAGVVVMTHGGQEFQISVVRSR